MSVRPVDASAPDVGLLSFDGLRAQLRSVGEERYHHKHPFHLMMHEGRLSRGQLQAWALNRYYYQSIDSDQGFDHFVARPRSGFSARVAQARDRS